VVSGLVQGVGYRFFVQRTALGLGLAGWVRNLADGTVEVHALGPEDALATLEQALRRGPAHARVTGVAASALGVEADPTNRFEIK
jgi:acylphosphatase